MFNRDDEILSQRATSSYPISIGTALALESLFPSRDKRYDEERERAEPFNFNKEYRLLVNVETMFRNLLGSVPSEVSKQVDPRKYAEVLYSEMEIIKSLCANEGGGYVEPFFYRADHKKLVGITNFLIKFREASTPAAKLYESIEKQTFDRLKKDEVHIPMITNRRDFPVAQDALIITHYPIELSAYKNYRSLLLVESHTGKIKGRNEWGSKYYKIDGEDMSRLPYTKKLLLIFGDRSHIKPFDLKVRREILRISKEGKWTPMTTDAKILFDVERFSLDDLLISFMRGV